MNGHDPCEVLAWDSGFFGVKIARVLGETLDEGRAGEIDAWCGREGVKCLYFLARSDVPETVRVAGRHGYELMEVRVEYELGDLDRMMKTYPSREGFTYRGAVPADMPGLKAIARESFLDSRFYVDARFPREKCDALYERWVEQSTQGFADEVLVAVQAEIIPAGFVTLKKEGAIGRISLIGVDARFRGRGVGANLVQGAVSWAFAKGLERVRVVTQGRNIASQRLYQRCGFLTHAVGLYYHKWF